MNPLHHALYAEDARAAHALFAGMSTPHLLQLQAAHRLDQTAATTPEGRVFSAGRLALIADILGHRGVRPDHATVASITCPFCTRVSYNANDIAQQYCGACHRFHHDEGRPVPV